MFLYDLNIWLLLLFSLFVGLCVHLYVIYNHLNYFPAPPYVFIFGHVFDYLDLHKSLETLTKNLVDYGGVVRQYLGPRKPSLVIANREFMQFLSSNSKYLGKSKFYKLLKPWLGEGLITSDGRKWLMRRKALAYTFTQTSVLTSFIKTFNEKADILIEILKNVKNEEINLHPIMKRLTLDVICETAMGIKLDSQLNSQDSNFAKSIETLCEVVQNRMTSFLKFFDFFYQFSNDCKREKKALAVVDRMLEKIIEKKLESRVKKGDFLHLLMEMEIDGEKLGRNDLREEINTFTFAGYDTSSSAMSAALYEIARNPHVQEKLLQEQTSLFEAEITMQALDKMTYLDMVIKETLRLHTIVPSIGRKLTKELQYGDKVLPELLNINVFIHGFHHNPSYFPDPEKFIPERFANPVDKFTYMPFGVKPRQCLGKNFAMLEMKCVLAKVIRNFDIVSVPERPMKLLPKLVLFSPTGIWVKLKTR